MIAALYVQTGGVYYGLPNVDPWDEQRDARLYAGPWPIVAHPPCKSWSQMGNCRPKTRAAGDGGTFKAALEAVRKYGGVIEHPAKSRAWRAFGLPRPGAYGWVGELSNDGGWSCEVDQAFYGHPCNKRTWLYYFGNNPPPAMPWGFAPDTGRKIAQDGGGGRDQRSRTPVAFRDALIAMAESAHLGRQSFHDTRREDFERQYMGDEAA